MRVSSVAVRVQEGRVECYRTAHCGKSPNVTELTGIATAAPVNRSFRGLMMTRGGGHWLMGYSFGGVSRAEAPRYVST